MVVLCVCLDSLFQNIPFQHRMVGIHFPTGSVRSQYLSNGQGASFEVLQCLGNGQSSLLIVCCVADSIKILSLCVVILWMVVSVGTIKGVISGKLFFAPCLADLRMEEEDKDVGKAA